MSRRAEREREGRIERARESFASHVMWRIKKGKEEKRGKINGKKGVDF